MDDLVWCALRRTYGYRGKYSGPGAAVRVPAGLQLAMELPKVDEPKPADDKPEPKAKAK